MIMNRLTAVENNQTLYMKYVEQQNGAIRDMIRRLGEDIGRLEGIVSIVLQRPETFPDEMLRLVLRGWLSKGQLTTGRSKDTSYRWSIKTF
jgi:hypothetical protein